MDDDEQQIRAVIDAYVTGFNRGDKRLLLEALHARFVSSGFFNGELQWDGAEEFADFCAESAPDPEGPVPDWQLDALIFQARRQLQLFATNGVHGPFAIL